jgi:hypothetical protein
MFFLLRLFLRHKLAQSLMASGGEGKVIDEFALMPT